ncbi:MAG: RNA polymerase sigma-70 factor [Bacteroidales bacterium]|nr:MAG: RNA polymerase sigma-70 factor [Bacteroidales bacterium]
MVVFKNIKKSDKSDQQSFEAIFRELQDDVYRFLYYIVKDADAAEDLLQDVFMKLWENRKNINADQSLKSYVMTIANRQALNYIRHQKVVGKFQAELAFDNNSSQSPDFILEDKELEQYFNAALEKMNSDTRAIFLLSRLDNKKYSEISEQMNLSIKTVESHISKALSIIRQTINIDILKKFHKK